MSTSKYEVASLTVEELLSPTTALFEVPAFQRTYSWGRDEVSQFIWDLFQDSTETDLPYFLGSIVVAKKEDDPKSPSQIVLDGQQRLTTVSLMIAALIDRLNQDVENNSEYILGFKSRILRQTTPRDQIRSPKVKLQREDSRDYENLIKEPEKCYEHSYRHSNIACALKIIFEQIDLHHQNFSYDDMMVRLLENVEIVRILSPNEQDAFRLFETLNDRGLALSAADLIKNKLFSKCASDFEDVREAWDGMNQSLREEDVVQFLRYYWLAFHGFVRSRELYKTFQQHIELLDSTAAGLFALELQDEALKYAAIARPTTTETEWEEEVSATLDRLNKYRAKSCRPVLLACSRYIPEKLKVVSQICESITVRYSIVGEKQANNLERAYEIICSKIRDNRSLTEIFGDDVISEIPNDQEFVEKLGKMDIRPGVIAWRVILGRISDSMGTGETEIKGAKTVHIEHVLPQKPSPKALKEAGFTSMEAAFDYVPRIGNLTLLSSKKNIKASNKPFSEKKSLYQESEISLSRELLEYDLWSAEVIEERSKRLSDIAATEFPHPIHIIQSS